MQLVQLQMVNYKELCHAVSTTIAGIVSQLTSAIVNGYII